MLVEPATPTVKLGAKKVCNPTSKKIVQFSCTKSYQISLSPSPSRRFRRSINSDSNCQLATTLQLTTYDDCMTHLHVLASFHALASEGLMQRDHRNSISSDNANSILEYCPSFHRSQTLVVSVLFNSRDSRSCMSRMSPTGKARLSRQKQAKICTLQIALESVLPSLENYTFRTTVGKQFPEFLDPVTASACGHDMHFKVLRRASKIS